MRRRQTPSSRTGRGRRVPGLLRNTPRLLRSRSEGHRAERRDSGGGEPCGPARALALPRERSDRGPTEVRQGPTEVRHGPSGRPAGARRRAKYRQVSPGAAFAARPRWGGKTFAGRGRGTRGEAAPPKYRQVSRGSRTSRTGRLPPPAGRSRRGGSTPAQAPRGCRAGRRRVKGPQNPSTAPARGAGGGSGRGLFAGSLTRPSPALPRQAGRRQARLHPAGADPRKGRQS